MSKARTKSATNDDDASKAALLSLVPMRKSGEPSPLYVHPTCVQAHVRAGWVVFVAAEDAAAASIGDH